jgi:hypothetical protein
MCGPVHDVTDSARLPVPKGKKDDVVREAASQLREMLARAFATKQPKWSVQATPRGLGVDIRNGEQPVALLWWDKDAWWCRRYPTPADPKKASSVEPIHELCVGFTAADVVRWILENDPATPRR